MYNKKIYNTFTFNTSTKFPFIQQTIVSTSKSIRFRIKIDYQIGTKKNHLAWLNSPTNLNRQLSSYIRIVKFSSTHIFLEMVHVAIKFVKKLSCGIQQSIFAPTQKPTVLFAQDIRCRQQLNSFNLYTTVQSTSTVHTHTEIYTCHVCSISMHLPSGYNDFR